MRYRTPPRRIIARGLLAAAGLVSAGTLFCRFAVNAEALGRHDLGLALAFAFGSAYGTYASLGVAAASAVMSVVFAFRDRRAMLECLGALVLGLIPLW